MTAPLWGLLILCVALALGWVFVVGCARFMDALMGDDDDAP